MKAIVVFLSLLAGAFAFSDCNCSFDYDPVCGSNGKTYTNMCEFKCAQKKRPGMSLVGHMECENIIMERASCICTMEYNPVCGSDGKTYGNPCAFRCAQRDNSELTMVGRDVCASLQYNQQDACICTREYNPVCGSDGLSYGNPCMLRCAMSQKPGLRFVKYGACEDNTPAYVDPCACTREFNPVCGSDGLTYGNPCMLRCAMSQKPGLKFVQYGECGRHFLLDLFAAPSCACNKMLRPVCGSDGKTYANPCLLNCAKKQNPALKLVKQGACGTSFLQREAQPLCACNRMFEPVCGSDRITYNNLCLFECAQKQKPELTLLKKGHCYNFLLEKENDDCVCSSVRKPVCGNDLKTYDNLCQFECAAKKKPGLKVMYPMVCIIM